MGLQTESSKKIALSQGNSIGTDGIGVGKW